MLKIMLVDDEKSVLNGLAYILKKHCPEYEIKSMVQSAKDALQVLATTEIDLVITDVMMPEVNGVILSKKIKNIYPHISVIVLSGYDDYEFVRQAMKNGAYDYLLKPCRYQTIIEILRKIEKEIFTMQRENEKMQRNKVLERLLIGQQQLPSESPATLIHMAVISADGCVETTFEQQYYKELELMYGTQYIDALVFENLFVMIFRKDISVEAVKKKLYKYRQQFSSKGTSSIRMAFHSVNESPDCLMNAYRTCKRMIEFMEFNELNIVMDDESYTKMMEMQKYVSITSHFSGKVIARLLMGSADSKILNYMETNLNQLYHLDINLDPNRIKREIILEIAYIEKEIKQNINEIEVGQQFDFIEEIKKIKTLRDILKLLKRYQMSLLILLQNENGSPHYIHASLNYIEHHYMKDITLQKVADTVYLNPWYLSSQFKKYTSKSFSEYLNQVRVRAAKELLEHKDLKVYQVAEMVGFQDAAYFSTVFKHFEQISPKEFQKTI